MPLLPGSLPDPCPLAGPNGPAVCLTVPCVICCGSAEQEVVGLLTMDGPESLC